MALGLTFFGGLWIMYLAYQEAAKKKPLSDRSMTILPSRTPAVSDTNSKTTSTEDRVSIITSKELDDPNRSSAVLPHTPSAFSVSSSAKPTIPVADDSSKKLTQAIKTVKSHLKNLPLLRTFTPRQANEMRGYIKELRTWTALPSLSGKLEDLLTSVGKLENLINELEN